MNSEGGYYHVTIKESDRDKSTFITPSGTYRWNVMTFGFTNAPATFQE